MTATTALTLDSAVLVADPDADDVSILGLLLRKAGITAALHPHGTAEDLIAALGRLLHQSMGVVLPLICFLEIAMPQLDGFAALEWIRAQPELDRMSVVVLARSESPGDVRKAARAGAQCYLAKYPRPTELRQVVDEAVRVAASPAAGEWFGIRANLLLRWGLPG